MGQIKIKENVKSFQTILSLIKAFFLNFSEIMKM